METGDKECAHAQAVKFPLEINSIFKIPISEKFPKWHTIGVCWRDYWGHPSKYIYYPQNWGEKGRKEGNYKLLISKILLR